MRLTTLFLLWLLSGILLAPETGAGQDRHTTSSVDAATYSYWLNRDWNALIRLGNEALEQGIDFYYLRYRMGIAWYEKKNYHRSIPHFQTAWRTNPEDPGLNEYLYYAFLFSGREYEAAHLETTFSPRLINRLNLPGSNPLKQAYVAYSFHPGASSNVTQKLDTSTEAEGYQTISSGYHLLNAGIEHRLGSRLWLHHSYTHIQRNFYQFYNVGELRFLNPDDMTYVNQYYLGTTALIRPGLDLRFGFHYIHLLNYVTSTIQVGGRLRAVTESVTNQNIAGFVSFYHRYRFVTAGVSSYIGNVNDATQYQQDAIVSLFPFGNLNLYATSVFSYQTEKMADDNWRNNLVFQQKIGLKMTGRIWVEADAALGELLHFYAHDGTVVFNDTDAITGKYGLGLHTVVTPRIHLRLNYVYLEKESRFAPIQTGFQFPEPISYSTSSITASILWKR